MGKGLVYFCGVLTFNNLHEEALRNLDSIVHFSEHPQRVMVVRRGLRGSDMRFYIVR